MKQKICPYCEKLIEAYNENQLEYLIQQHILSMHKDKVKFENAVK